MSHWIVHHCLPFSSQLSGEAIPKYGTLAYRSFRVERIWEMTDAEKILWSSPKTGHKILKWEKFPPYSRGKGVPLPPKIEGPRPQELSQWTGLTVSPIHCIWLVLFLIPSRFPTTPHQTSHTNRLKCLFGSSWRLPGHIKLILNPYVCFSLINQGLQPRIQRVKKQYFLTHTQNPYGQRSLAGWSPWDCKSGTPLSD